MRDTFFAYFLLGGKIMDIKKFSKDIVTWGRNKKLEDIYVLPQKSNIQIIGRRGECRFNFKYLSLEEGEKLIFHFKFIGSMDVGEKRKPQVGSVTYLLDEGSIRLRLSTVGDFDQKESLVIRFLYCFQNSRQNFLIPNQRNEIYQKMKQRGLHLFCGPVGSGKTTLMYTVAKLLAEHQQVISIEDPVEIEEESFLQLQVNSKIGITYDLLIKACLRHRPDILIIGEIRDSVTAKAAIRAALTGHIVYATLHARNIPGVYERLLELGIQEVELLECVSSVLYQRLLSIAVKNQIYDNGLLLDYDFEQSKISRWEDKLRKVWAYGFIDSQTFEEEKGR